MKTMFRSTAGMLALVGSLLFGSIAFAEPVTDAVFAQCVACASDGYGDGGAPVAVVARSAERVAQGIDSGQPMQVLTVRSYMRSASAGYMFANLQRHERIDTLSPC